MPLFEIKTAICEVTHSNASQIVLNKIEKKVYFVDGSELRLVCKLMPSGNMDLEEDIDETIRTKSASLVVPR